MKQRIFNVIIMVIALIALALGAHNCSRLNTVESFNHEVDQELFDGVNEE